MWTFVTLAEESRRHRGESWDRAYWEDLMKHLKVCSCFTEVETGCQRGQWLFSRCV